jgi:hypothetical protein
MRTLEPIVNDPGAKPGHSLSRGGKQAAKKDQQSRITAYFPVVFHTNFLRCVKINRKELEIRGEIVARRV